jgi:hypothetical protein
MAKKKKEKGMSVMNAVEKQKAGEVGTRKVFYMREGREL